MIGLFLILFLNVMKFLNISERLPLFLIIEGLVITIIGTISELEHSRLEEKNAIYMIIIITVTLLIIASVDFISSLFFGVFISVIFALWFFLLYNKDLKEENKLK